METNSPQAFFMDQSHVVPSVVIVMVTVLLYPLIALVLGVVLSRFKQYRSWMAVFMVLGFPMTALVFGTAVAASYLDWKQTSAQQKAWVASGTVTNTSESRGEVTYDITMENGGSARALIHPFRFDVIFGLQASCNVGVILSIMSTVTWLLARIFWPLRSLPPADLELKPA